MSTQTYTYTELQSFDLRLLTIEPGDQQVSVKCHVFKRPEQLPPYYALSYVWGDSSRMKTILLGERSFQVTENLHAALQQLRSNNPIQTYYWIDAICINQSDEEEKSRQVPRMGRIYHNALRVLAWLGSNDCRALFESAQKATDFRLKHGLDQDLEVFYDAFCAADNGYLSGWMVLAWCQHEMDQLLQSPFFSRIWIMQEVLLAKEWPLMCSGESTIGMDSLLLFWHLLKAKAKNNLCVIDTRLSLDQLYKGRLGLWDVILAYRDVPQSNTLTAKCLWGVLLSQTFGYESSMPHDKIYGTLGMLVAICGIAALPEHLTPNYALPFEKVYWDYSKFIIEHTGDLTMLCSSGAPLKNTPTWVPDLRMSAGIRRESETVRSRFSENFAPHISSDGTTLTLEATRLGRCTAVCPQVYNLAIPDMYSGAHRRWLKERGQLIDDQLCKPAAATLSVRPRSLSQTRRDVLRPDGILPAKDSMKALLMDLYHACCLSILPENPELVDEHEYGERDFVWHWLEIQLRQQLFLADSGDVGTIVGNDSAIVMVGDEVFLFDDVPFAFVLRREPLGILEHQYILVACARIPAAEAHAEEGNETMFGSEKVRINIV